MTDNIDSSGNLLRRDFLKKSAKYGIAAPSLLSLISSCSVSMSASGKGNKSAEKLKRMIESDYSRMPMAHLPTPLEKVEKLAGHTSLPKFFMKRDDATGLAFGGNKTRKVEYIVADAIDKGADTIVTWGSLQSNWCRQTTAGCTMYGLKPVLILGKKDEKPVTEFDGNLLLDKLFGAEVHYADPGRDRAVIALKVADELKANGKKPYVVAVGGSRPGYDMERPIGALGYMAAYFEMFAEAEQNGVRFSHIVHATGSAGTQAGLVVAAKAINPEAKIVGISISGRAEGIKRNVSEISNQLAKMLGLQMSFTPDDIIVYDDYVGEGYGIMTPETVEAIKITAREEGILLDPVYTGKAMAGTFGLIDKGIIRQSDTVCFIHTGGTPAIFPYREKLLEKIKSDDDIEDLWENWPV